MPFEIVRNDIVKMQVDAVVNTANPNPVIGSGVDSGIHKKAGPELLAARQKIGCIDFGDAVITPGFGLDAKYVIHTAGPIWEDGNHKEEQILSSCYRKSLALAKEHECESVAFPLIATGNYGFPKPFALQIAVREISVFLLENEMQIILVVFDKKSFQLSGQLVGEIDSFIDANYIRQKRRTEYSRRPFSRSRIESNITYDSEVYEECSRYTEAEESEPELLMSVPMPEKAMSLEEELENVGMSFHDKLFELIGESGMDNKDVWKRANLDRKHFSKIQCDEKYHPKKKTVMALCIALELDLEQAKDLLARADWAFSPSSKVDLIVQKAIIDKQYDIYQLNLVLFQYTNEILGV